MAGVAPTEELALDDFYRPLRRADCGEIARHYNRNLAELDPVWCAASAERTGDWIWLHRLVLGARGRGRVIDQVHERRGRVVSYFAGHARSESATFSIGVVDLDLPDPLDTWRRDAARLFATALRQGAGEIRVRASSDRAWFVGWMEQEVGMVRRPDGNVWAAGRAAVARYIREQDETPEPAAAPDPGLCPSPVAAAPGEAPVGRVGREG